MASEVTTVAVLARLCNAVTAYVEQHGVEHEEGCSEDATCECPLVNGINEAFAAALPIVKCAASLRETSRETIYRDLSTPEKRAFWARCEASAAEVKTWPDWKRAGINVAALRETPREPVTVADDDVEPER